MNESKELCGEAPKKKFCSSTSLKFNIVYIAFINHAQSAESFSSDQQRAKRVIASYDRQFNFN